MHTDIRHITEHYFGRRHPDEVEVEDIRHLIGQYPYFAPARLMLATKEDSTGDALVTAGLYLHNPLWLTSVLEKLKNASDWAGSPLPDPAPPATEPVPAVTPAPTMPVTPVEETPITFQSYHTIDYFASQGIRLQQAELNRDKLGQQMKSFTEWLRSMKKLPAATSEIPQAPEDESRQQQVIRNAAHSIEEKHVITEAMAEVWIKQGQTHKAVEIYEKLSLQNPGKSDYFAAKINQLK